MLYVYNIYIYTNHECTVYWERPAFNLLSYVQWMWFSLTTAVASIRRAFFSLDYSPAQEKKRILNKKKFDSISWTNGQKQINKSNFETEQFRFVCVCFCVLSHSNFILLSLHLSVLSRVFLKINFVYYDYPSGLLSNIGLQLMMWFAMKNRPKCASIQLAYKWVLFI